MCLGPRHRPGGHLPDGTFREQLPDGRIHEVRRDGSEKILPAPGRLTLDQAAHAFGGGKRGAAAVHEAVGEMQLKDIDREIREFHVLRPGEPLINDPFLVGLGERMLGVSDPELVKLALNHSLQNGSLPVWARRNRQLSEAAPEMRRFLGETLNRRVREGKLSLDELLKKMPSVFDTENEHWTAAPAWHYVPPEKLDPRNAAHQALAARIASAEGLGDPRAFLEWMSRRRTSHPGDADRWSSLLAGYRAEAPRFAPALAAEGARAAQAFLSRPKGSAPDPAAVTEMLDLWKLAHVDVRRLDPNHPDHQLLLERLGEAYFGRKRVLGRRVTELQGRVVVGAPPTTLLDLIEETAPSGE